MGTAAESMKLSCSSVRGVFRRRETEQTFFSHNNSRQSPQQHSLSPPPPSPILNSGCLLYDAFSLLRPTDAFPAALSLPTAKAVRHATPSPTDSSPASSSSR